MTPDSAGMKTRYRRATLQIFVANDPRFSGNEDTERLDVILQRLVSPMTPDSAGMKTRGVGTRPQDGGFPVYRC